MAIARYNLPQNHLMAFHDLVHHQDYLRNVQYRDEAIFCQFPIAKHEEEFEVILSLKTLILFVVMGWLLVIIVASIA
jgi:hypothetical protein